MQKKKGNKEIVELILETLLGINFINVGLGDNFRHFKGKAR